MVKRPNTRTNLESPITGFYTHDGNKNVSEVIASNNDVAAHYEYAPFGALTVSCGVSAAANHWRLSSEYAEDDTATIYYNFRHYISTIGRRVQNAIIKYCLYFVLFHLARIYLAITIGTDRILMIIAILREHGATSQDTLQSKQA